MAFSEKRRFCYQSAVLHNIIYLIIQKCYSYQDLKLQLNTVCCKGYRKKVANVEHPVSLPGMTISTIDT